MRIIIIGSGGMLGSELYEGYKDTHEVWGIDRDVVNKENHIRADITDYNHIDFIVNKIRPEIIINCAALIDVEYCENNKELSYLINSKSAGRIAYIAEKYGARIIYISSNMVYGEPGGKYVESSVPSPMNWYGTTKFAGEVLTAKANDYIILRTNIFGWKPGSFGYWLYDSITTNRSIYLYSDIYFNCLYVKDLLKPMENMFTAKPGVYHITSTDSMSKYDFGKLLIKSLDDRAMKGEKVSKARYESKDGIERPRKAVLDCKKYETTFGNLPTMKTTLNRFLKDNPYGRSYDYER